MRLISQTALLIGLVACTPGHSRQPDAGATDAGTVDAGMVDAGRPSDSGVDDAGADGGSDDSGPDVDAGPGDGRFALLSLNLHCLETDGTSYADNGARLDAIAMAAADEDVDVLALQEACDDGTTSAMDVLEAALEARTGGPWTGLWEPAHLAWEGTAREAMEGVGLLVRGFAADNVRITHAVQGSLQRVAVGTTVQDGPAVLSVHFDHEDEAVRLMQARETAVSALAWRDPSLDVLVAGDLNARAGTAPHGALVAAGFLDASDALRASRIDHVLLHRGSVLRPVDSRLLFDGSADAVSDHPGVLVRFGPAVPDAVSVTRIIGRADVGPGRYLSIRGDTAPLDWTSGWPMHNVAAAEWRFVSTELSGNLEFKLLRGDADWQTGPNENGMAGVDHDVTPTF